MQTLHQAAPFTVKSAGGGALYLFTHHKARRDVTLQGDDADAFALELEALEMLRPFAPLYEILTELWSLYAEASQPMPD